MLEQKRLAKKIKEKEPYLNALEELDRTGRLRKTIYKERVTFTIDEAMMIKFRDYCKKNSISMSNKVESLIREFLK